MMYLYTAIRLGRPVICDLLVAERTLAAINHGQADAIIRQELVWDEGTGLWKLAERLANQYIQLKPQPVDIRELAPSQRPD
jgi:hypothetical protein